MSRQKTLDGKTDCRKTNAGSVVFRGRCPDLEAAIKKMHERCPCIKVTLNGERLQEKPDPWEDKSK